VLFQGEVWYVCESNAWVDKSKSVLIFTYLLAGGDYNKALPKYNPAFRGRSLTGKVIERQAEKLRLHLDIDEEQSVEDAYFYTWLPESGNIMYNMPPLETCVSLYMQNDDEHSAICIRNVRANGSSCSLTQDVSQRFLMTEPGKSLSLKPETMDLTATGTGDSALLDDNFGCSISSKKEVIIKAAGNISIRGATVDMKAPKEVTMARGNLGEPTVLNLCHNVDSIGGKGKFQATGKYLKNKGKKGNFTSIKFGAGETNPEAEQEKREKLKFELAELIKQNDTEPQFDISDVFQTALSAIPQRAPNDEFARFSAGSRVLFGKTEDYMHVVISEKWRDWEKSGNKQGDPVISKGDVKSNNKRDAAERQAKGNTR
jgi:phage baseplate assembly protein gpV